MSLGERYLQDVSFIEILFLIIIGWVLVSLAQRCLDNFTFVTLGLRRESTFDTTVIFFTAAFIFITFVFVFNNIYGNLLETGTETALSPPEPLGRNE